MNLFSRRILGWSAPTSNLPEEGAMKMIGEEEVVVEIKGRLHATREPSDPFGRRTPDEEFYEQGTLTKAG